MKKVLTLILCVLLIGILTVPAFAAQSASMSVSASKNMLSRGDTFTVTVSTTAVENCTSGGFMFTYDKNVFEYVSGSALLSGFSAGVSTAAGNVAGYFMNGNATVQGGLFQITLRVKDTAPFGTYSISGTPSLTASDGAVSCGAGSAVVKVACDHSYSGWSDAGNGKHSKTCSVCQDVQSLDHDWNGGTVTKPASCKEEGVMTLTCTTCSATKTEAIDKTNDHSYGGWVKVNDTIHKHTCSVCTKEETANHTWDSGKVTKPASCKEGGEKTYTCDDCDHKKVEKMNKTTDHSYSKWTEVDGSNHKHICSVCEKEETAAHTWNSGAVTKKPNCKETGIRTFTCTGCSATYTEDIDKTEDHKYGKWEKVDADNHKHICSICQKEETVAHTYKTSWSKDKSGHWHECSGCKDKKDFVEHTPGPKATEKTAQTCTVCKYVIKAALGHTHKWDKELTQDEEGHWYACAGCEEKKDAAAHDFENGCDPDCATCGYTREVAHDISDAWTSDGTNHWHECTICGLKKEEAAHEPGAEATEFTAQTCTICGKELVAALGHSFSEEWNSDGENHWRDCACGEKGDLAKHTYADGVCSVCGAEEPMSFVIWIIVGVVAVAAIAVGAVLVIKKKK